jgi:hypothetical protein
MMQVEIVKWEDHWSQGGGWKKTSLFLADEDIVPCIVTTVGILLKEDKEHLYVCQTMDPVNDSMSSIFCILKKVIVSRRTIKLKG